MQRTIEQWQACNPAAMAYTQSDTAKYHAFLDAKLDILELYDEAVRLRRKLQFGDFNGEGD